jgi:hypothetical protein
LWDCRFCSTQKLLGVDHRHCPNCGAAQDPQWRYFPSEDDKKTVSDPKYTYAGVDKVCPFCNQPNSAAAKFCKACGGDLTGAKEAVVKDAAATALGQDVAGVVDDVAKQRWDKEQAAIRANTKKGGLSRGMIILGVLALLCVGLIGAFIFLSSSTYSVTASVTDMNWERVIVLEKFTSFQEGNWQSSVPVGAYNTSCYAKDRQEDETYTEVCGVERVDRGDGSFVERDKMCTRHRTVNVPDTYCNYTVDRWISAGEMKSIGNASEALIWPDFRPKLTAGLGAEREASRKQILNILFTTKGDKPQTFTYNPDDETIWQSFKIGQIYSVEVNRLNVPKWETLKPVEPR